MASVATMTGTLVDSGCKHIIPTRVCMDTLLNLNPEHMQTMLQRDKMRYCAHRMDLLLCVNTPLLPASQGAFQKSHAYPRVLSTLGDISPTVRQAITRIYSNPGDYMHNGHFSEEKLKGSIPVSGGIGEEEHHNEEQKQALGVVQKLPFFTFMGFSLGLGYVHPSSGDTVVSSMIGGMLSVQNGHFHMNTGDAVQWYFVFEQDQFDKHGRRGGQDQSITKDAGKRLFTHLREQGIYSVDGKNNGPPTEGKMPAAFPKPYRGNLLEDQSLDRFRIFGKALSNARPYDKVDILICTQSI